MSNHEIYNGISLYQLADLLSGKKVKFKHDLFNYIEFVSAYSWNVMKYLNYDFDTVGIMFQYDSGIEKWIHFSKDAFIGAVCIVATREDVTFDDDEHESLRQSWARKSKGFETSDDKYTTEKDQCNFTEDWYFEKIRKNRESCT